MATNAISSSTFNSGNRLVGMGAAGESTLILDPEQLRKTEFVVYLHTISRREFLQPSGIYRNIRIPKCPAEKRSHCFMQIQHPVQMPHLNPDDVNGVPVIRIENAIRVALGICNPSYSGTDLKIQDKELPPETVIASGECNLNRQGIFASMNPVPTEEELVKAEKRREAYYRFRLNEANGLERSNPKELQRILTEDHNLAAEYFGVETNWHLIPKAKTDCPNCGQKIPVNVAFHYDNGRICVLDWEKAWLAGAVKKDDVPEPKQWWPQQDLKPGQEVPVEDMSKEQLKKFAGEIGLDVDMRMNRENMLAAILQATKV